MTTTFKLYHGAATDGVAYLDMPYAGKIVGIAWAIALAAGAGGIGLASAELSRVAVNQVAVNNPRGVIDSIYINTSAASTGNCVNTQRTDMQEPIKAGERLYINAAGSAANVASIYIECYVTLA